MNELREQPRLRAATRTELVRRGWSIDRLVRELRGNLPKNKHVPTSVIYQWLLGGTPLNSDDLGLVMEMNLISLIKANENAAQ